MEIKITLTPDEYVALRDRGHSPLTIEGTQSSQSSFQGLPTYAKVALGLAAIYCVSQMLFTSPSQVTQVIPQSLEGGSEALRQVVPYVAPAAARAFFDLSGTTEKVSDAFTGVTDRLSTAYNNAVWYTQTGVTLMTTLAVTSMVRTIRGH